MKNKEIGHLLRSKQAAAWMGMSLSTFYLKVKRGELPAPAYRALNSVAWDSTELDAAKASLFNKDIKDNINMTIKEQVASIEHEVLDDLLTGYHITHASIDDYKSPGMNCNMQHVISSLRKNYHVIIYYSRKNNGYWYISAKNAAQFRQNPIAQRARKEDMDTERKNLRLENTILSICENHPKMVVACLVSKQTQNTYTYTH